MKWSALAWVCALLPLGVAPARGQVPAPPPWPTVREDGVLVRSGQPYRAVGVNYFDAIYRHLQDPKDTSYERGFSELASMGIPFVRVMGCGFWPTEQKLYLDNKEEFLRRFDDVVRAAEQHGVGLIPSLFWNVATVPDLVGDACSEWGNPDSRTAAHMRAYVSGIVGRYRSSPAIWGWEFGNEFNLGANLPNASEHRPAVWPQLGTAAFRTEKDEWTYETIRSAFEQFGREVRRFDPSRIICTGDGFPRESGWHNWKEKTWTRDSDEQQAELLRDDNPDPINLISVHAYGEDVTRIAPAVAVARALRKPLFVGEFGVPGRPDDETRAKFAAMMKAIEDAEVPLACVWVYDHGGDDEFGVTGTNARAYQLEAIRDANARLRAE